MLSYLSPGSVFKLLFICLIFVYLPFRLTKSYLIKRRHDRLAQSLGCKPTKQWKTRDPIFGLDFIFEQFQALRDGNIVENSAKRFEKMGCRTGMLRILGHVSIGTIEPANVQAVLATDFPSWDLPDQRKHHLVDFLGEGIFTTDGTAWKHSREMIRPSFARHRIEDLHGNLETHCQNLIACITPGEEVDLQPLFFAFTMDVATEFLFGESSGMLVRIRQKMKGQSDEEKQGPTAEKSKVIANSEDVTPEEFIESFTYCQSAVEGGVNEDDSKWIGFIKLFLPNRKLKMHYKVIHRYIDKIVYRALSSADSSTEPSKPNFLTTLISHTRNPLKLRAEILNTLLAARDTTASLLSNVWFELPRRPEIWRHLRHDIAAILRESSGTEDQEKTKDDSLLHLNQAPTYSDLKSLPYLTALLKESLRLFPVVPSNSRQATRDTTLPLGGGPDGKSPVFIPKGTLIFWELWGMHRRQDLFGADAEQFRVERWLDSYSSEDESNRDIREKDGKEDDHHDEATYIGLEDPNDEDEVPRYSSEKNSSPNSKMPIKRKGLRPSWEFLPFNGGPRICVGQQFALAEAAYVTIRLMQAFSGVEPRGTDVWKEKIGLVMTVKGGTRCVFRK